MRQHGEKPQRHRLFVVVVIAAPEEPSWLRVGTGVSIREELFFGFAKRHFGAIAAMQRAQQTVVVPRRDRVVLVVVAASASERQPQQSGADRRDHVVEFVVPVAQPLIDHQLVRQRRECSRREKSRGGHRLGILWLIFIPGELPTHELVKRQVFVQRTNDEVAVSISLRSVAIRFLPVAVRIPRHVEPMPPPTLAVMWRIEQLGNHQIHHGWSRRRGSRLKFDTEPIFSQPAILHIQNRRQSDDIEVDSSDQLPRTDRRRRRQPAGFQFREDELIDRRAAPSTVLDGRQRDIVERLKRPVLAILRRDDHFLATASSHTRFVRPRGALVDPLPQQFDLFGTQRIAFGRHPLVVVPRCDATNQLALLRLLRNDRLLARVSSPHGTSSRIKPQPALLLLVSMTLHAMLLQRRPDIANEINLGSRRSIQH